MNWKASILIVDDIISLCKTMSFILRRKGYAVAFAKDGSEAIQEVKKRPFDTVFMDIKMPLMNGVETFRRIKKIRPETIVVMMTAYAVEDLIQEALQEGAYEIMYKPLDIDKVISLVERAKENRNGTLILVADDDPGICITMENIFMKKGYKVGIVHTGEEAVAMVKQRAWNIIFVDIKLPVLNGLETYLAIREIDSEAVVIMMTAFRQEVKDIVEKALNSSAYACLYKPLDMEEVLGLVEEIWKRKNEKGADTL